MTVGTQRKISWFSVLLLLLTLFFSGRVIAQEYRLYQVRAETKIVSRHIEELQQQQAALQQEKQQLNDPVYLEQLAREKLNLVRSGEVPCVVVAERP